MIFHRVTGFTFFKVGKATAAAIGSGIFILQIANHSGYIKINWDKVTKKAEELSEKLDENSSKPNLMQKVSIFFVHNFLLDHRDVSSSYYIGSVFEHMNIQF